MSLRAAVPLYQQRGLVLTSAPASEPVTATELRTHLRTDSTELPDAEANALITDARTEIENMTALAFITQTWRLALDRWPAGGEAWWDGVREMSITELYRTSTIQSITLPRWPLASITSITTYDEASTPTSVTVANVFDIDTYRTPGRLTLKRGQTWPIALRGSNAIEIVYVAGYANAAAVPSPMKRAVKQLAAFLYSNRGDDCDPSQAYVDSGAQAIMAQYKVAQI
jgi:uncharacterized phiE125 gp8 family phage protein